MNRPRQKGTTAETAVVGYLQEHGWPYAERRALKGVQDRGDVTGCPGLVFEVKYSSTAALRIAQWLTETGIEKLNAGADHGILVVKPPGVGVLKVASWYAVTTAREMRALATMASWHDLFVVDGPPMTYSTATLAFSLHAAVKAPSLAPNEVVALTLKPPGTRDDPERWYRVMTLEHMTRLLRAAGYGDKDLGHDGASEPGPVLRDNR